MNVYLIYLNFLIPLIVKIIIPDYRYGYITLYTDLLILPTILFLVNIYLIFYRNTKIRLLKLWAFMFIGQCVGIFTGYIIWGLSRKYLLNPDAETIVFYAMMFFYYFSISSIFFLIVAAIQYTKSRHLNKAKTIEE